MGRYIVKRLLWMIPVVIGVSLLIMLMLELTPGDPARLMLGNYATDEAVEALRVEWGLNDPLIVRFGKYILNALHGDLGVSYHTKQPVFKEIMDRFPFTLILVCISMVIAIVTGIPIGVYAASHQYTWKDNAAIVGSLFCVSMPNFWFALILVQIFATKLGWLPSLFDKSWMGWIMPAIAVAIGYSATIARQARSSMLEQIRQDYVTTARAKGQTERKVIYEHALTNALIPVIVVCGAVFGMSLGGAVVAETIFSIPGLGNYTLSALTARDYPAVQGSVLFFALLYSLVILIVDLIFAFVDPRIRSQYNRKKSRNKTENEKESGPAAEEETA